MNEKNTFAMRKIPRLFSLCTIKTLLLFLFWAITGCAVNQDESLQPQAQGSELQPSLGRLPGIYPDSIRIYYIIAQYPNSTWKDIDNYYKNDIPRYHEGQDYTGNLKKFAIFHLVNTYDLINNAEKETIEYYVNEQMEIPIVNTDVFIKCLKGLKGYWTDERIKSTALTEYDKLINYVKFHMKDPEGVLQRHNKNFNKLKDFAENY